jgi:hypothetical protein
MSIALFTSLQDSLFGMTGDLTYVALGILLFFIIILLFVGLDLKFAIILTAPLGVAFSPSIGFGWLPIWVAISYWVLVVGMGIFTIWTYISER